MFFSPFTQFNFTTFSFFDMEFDEFGVKMKKNKIDEIKKNKVKRINLDFIIF